MSPWVFWTLATAAISGVFLWKFERETQYGDITPIGSSFFQDTTSIREPTVEEGPSARPPFLRPDLLPGSNATAPAPVLAPPQRIPSPSPPPPPPLPPPSRLPDRVRPPFSTSRTTRRAPPRDAQRELRSSSPLVSEHDSLRELGTKDPEVVGKLALATLLPAFDEEAYRMLLSVQMFQAGTTVFVSCTQEVGHLLPKFFPKLRLILFPWLQLDTPLPTNGHATPPAVRKYGTWADYETEKSQILRTAFQHGASPVWYMESDMILFQALPTLDAATRAATSAQRAGHDKKRGASSPGLMYFSSLPALESYEQDQHVAHDLGCSHSVGWYEVDAGYSSTGSDRYGDVKCSASKVTFNGCTVASMQYRDYHFARRWLPVLLPPLQACRHPVEPIFQTVDEGMRQRIKNYAHRTYQANRFPKDPFYMAPGPCPGTWCRSEGPPKVIFEKSLFDLASPAAHVRGQVVISVVIPDLHNDEVHQFLRSIETFMVTTAIFVSCTQEVARQLPMHYPMLRFLFQVVLDKYQDEKTGLARRREELIKAGLWVSYLAEGPNIARFALQNGARGVWSMDLRMTLLAELPPVEENTKVSLNPSSGPGLAYFAAAEKIDKWLASVNERQDATEAGLEVFAGDSEVRPLECGAEVGRTFVPSDAALDFVCIRGNAPGEGVVLWKDCPVTSLRYPTLQDEVRMTPSLFKALGECQHMALPVIQRVLPPVMLQHKLIESYDPFSHILGHVVLATTILTVTNEVHRFLQSVSAFEAETTIFASVTQNVADELQDSYPSLRFCFHAHLDKYREQSQGTLPSLSQMVQAGTWAGFSSQKAVLIRIAFRAGAKAVWYISPEAVLTAPLPTMDPGVGVAYAPKELPRSTSGIIYFGCPQLPSVWLDATASYLEENGAFPTHEGTGEKSVGLAASSASDFISQTLRTTFPGERHVLGCGHGIDFRSDGGPSCSTVQCQSGSLEISGCKLYSLLLGPSSDRTASCLKPRFEACAPSAAHLVEGPISAPRSLEVELSRKDWVRAFSPDALGIQPVRYFHQTFRATDPSVNVVGKVVAAMISNGVDGEAMRMLRGLQVFEPDVTIFVGCTQKMGDEVWVKFPNMRFSIYPHFDKYRKRPGWGWLGRDGMEKMKGAAWMHFNLEKPRIMKHAIAAGATGVWYADTDCVQVNPFQVHPFSVKAGLSPHRYAQEKVNIFGYINAGYVYFSSIPMTEKWIDVTCADNSDIHNRDQVGLSKLITDPDAFENDCGVDAAAWQMNGDLNLLGESHFSLLRCVDNKVMFKDCHLSSMHFHLNNLIAIRLAQYLEKAMLECHPPGLEVMPKGTAAQPLPTTPLNTVEPMTERKTTIPLNSPRSGIPGKVVVCLVLQRFDAEMWRLVGSIAQHEADKTIIAAVSEDAAVDLHAKFKSTRFAFWRQMNKFRQPPTYHWPTPDEMIQTGKWRSFRQVKFDMMRTALDNGAAAVWYLGLDVVLTKKLPTLPSNKKVALVRHSPIPVHQPKGGTGIYDEGLIYAANKEALHRIETLSKTPENYDSLQGSPDLEEFSLRGGNGTFWYYAR